jgi:hypothetical protein
MIDFGSEFTDPGLRTGVLMYHVGTDKFFELVHALLI